jgi:hypothetical protein
MTIQTIQTILTVIPSIVTAFLVAIAVRHLRLTRELAQLSFEDSLNKEYRSLAMEIPVDVLLGMKVSEDTFPKIREYIYNYIDLCNEQVFLRKKDRITTATWWEWAEGIRSNLENPIFLRVWSEIKEASPKVFKELRQLEASEFKEDPKLWK